MRAVFGLGNPGSRYQFTRHNIGFILLDHFADRHKLKFSASQRDYYLAKGELKNPSKDSENSPFVLIKPSTYVNLSGIAALDITSQYQIQIEDFLVVYDDINLEPGKLRVRLSGGDGGHNGVHSIVYHLNSDKFLRLRFGIGKQFEQGEMAEYVLKKLSDEEYSELQNSFQFAIELIEAFIRDGSKGLLDHFSSTSSKKIDAKKNNKKEGT